MRDLKLEEVQEIGGGPLDSEEFLDGVCIGVGTIGWFVPGGQIPAAACDLYGLYRFIFD